MSSSGSRAARGAVVLATLLIAEGHARSQARPSVSMLPLKQIAYLKASNAEAYDHFACGGGNQGHSGNSIAMSADGSTIVVGAPYESSGAKGINGNQHDNSIRQAGAVYVFTRTGTTWTQQAYVKASNTGRAGERDLPGDGDQFGYSIALSGDGNTLAVSAYVEDNGGRGIRPPELQPFLVVDYLDPWREHRNQAEESGAVYLFTRRGSTWTQGAYVKGSNTDAGDAFGSAVALSGKGRTMVVGAHNEDSTARGINGNEADNSADDSGQRMFLCTEKERRRHEEHEGHERINPDWYSWSSCPSWFH